LNLQDNFSRKSKIKSLQKMLIARVIGNVVATHKNQRYEGSRIMLCRQITPKGEDMDYTCLALDSVNAGEGDIVIIAQEGWSASTAATGKPGAAIDSAIVGVIDYIDLLPAEK
jgi:ethanolamine utilization protein EutN